MGFSIINQPFWGFPIYGNPHVVLPHYYSTCGRAQLSASTDKIRTQAVFCKLHPFWVVCLTMAQWPLYCRWFTYEHYSEAFDLPSVPVMLVSFSPHQHVWRDISGYTMIYVWHIQKCLFFQASSQHEEGFTCHESPAQEATPSHHGSSRRRYPPIPSDSGSA